jgi:hypothetical protein
MKKWSAVESSPFVRMKKTKAESSPFVRRRRQRLRAHHL